MKVGLIGSAGTGRATVAAEAAEALNIPLLASRTLTQPILQRDGYDYSSGIFVEKFLASEKRELELIQARLELEQSMPSFVADRTTLDHFTYLLLEVHQYTEGEVEGALQMCRDHMGSYTHLFYIPWKDGELEDNQLRTLNKWFQMTVDCVIRGLVHSWKLSVETLNPDNAKAVLSNLS